MNRINLSESELVALAARIQRNYDYDAERGLLVNRKTGKMVKGIRMTHANYRRFGFWHHGKMKFLNYHWAVWAWHHGRFPEKQIDHVNGVETDNRIENLREVSGSENKLNMLHDWQPNRDTGLPGVCPHGRGYTNKIHGKNCHFHDPFEAFFYATLCGKIYKG